MIEKYINDNEKECYKGVTDDTQLSDLLFHTASAYEDDKQFALHTNLGSLTVLDRMTGFGYRDIETGFRDKEGKFWLATGDCDVRYSGVKTIREAIDWVKSHADICNGCPEDKPKSDVAKEGMKNGNI